MSGAEGGPSPRRRDRAAGSGGGAFEPDPMPPGPRGLPRPPEDDGPDWTIMQVISAAVLVLFGVGLVGVFALGLPLELIGGKVVLAAPIFAVLVLARGGRKRRGR